MEIVMPVHHFSWISTLRSAAWFSPLGAIRMPQKTSIKASGAAPHSALIAELSMDADHGVQSLSARFQFESSSSIRLFDTKHTPVRVKVFLSMLTSLSFHKNLRPFGFSVHPAMTADTGRSRLSARGT
jgi:hypothetical protein